MRYPKTMRNTVLLLAAFLLLASCGAECNFRRGEKYLALGEYFDAANEYRQSYQKTAPKERSRRGQIACKMGYCYAKGCRGAMARFVVKNRLSSPDDLNGFTTDGFVFRADLGDTSHPHFIKSR